MKTNVNYSFIPVPRVYEYLDDKCFRFLVYLIDKERYYSSINKIDNKGYFFISNETINKVLGYSTKTINNIVETLYRNKIINVISEGKQGKLITNRYSVNYETINSLNSKIERVDRNEIKSYREQNSTGENNFGQNSTGRDNNTETNFGNNSTDNFGQNSTVYKSISSKSTKSIKNNIYGPNIGPNIYSYIEGKKDFSSKSESNPIAESETVNNRDNSNIDNLNKEKLKGSKESVNSNNVNTAVLSPSNVEFEEYVISTEKSSENGLKQAKTRELEIINKTDNSNSVKSNNTANAVTEETVYSNIDNSKEVEGNNNRDNSKLVNSDNRTNNISTIVEYSTANAELESNNSVNSKNVIPNNNLDNSKNVIPNNNLDNSKNVNSNTANAVTEKVEIINSVKPVIEEIEEENKTDNSNEGIDNTIAFGDNPTAYAVSEFRDKCTKYTIIIEGKETEIDQPIEEYIRCYYNRIMNSIYNTNDFNKKRKIFNKILNENKLFGEQYDEMSDNLDIRYSRYLELDKQQAKQTDKEEFSNEEIQYIANELLQQCLNFRLTSENNMQDFYNLRNNYNAFIEEYNVPKEGLKLQEKFAELSVVNKKLNTPVFAN